MDMVKVKSFYDHYHSKIKTRPDLYRSGQNAVDVILPNDLLEYANAASGHSGFGSGARARGIRRECNNSKDFLESIFESPESLAQFLNSSEKNADAYIATVRQKHDQKINLKIMTNDPTKGFWSKYNKDTLSKLKSSNDPKLLRVDYDNLSLSEFEQKYKLVA